MWGWGRRIRKLLPISLLSAELAKRDVKVDELNTHKTQNLIRKKRMDSYGLRQVKTSLRAFRFRHIKSHPGICSPFKYSIVSKGSDCGQLKP